MQAAARTQAAASDIPFPEDYQGAHLARRRSAGFQLYAAMGVARGDRTASAALALRNFDFFGAPHVLVLTTCRALGPYALLDCGGWIANFLLIAQAHGLGAIAQAALARHSDVVRASLDLPPDALVVCGISFGYADAGHPANSYRTARAAVGEAVQRIDR
ncbi:Nitroreductase family protein [compost metagenome]